MSGGSRGREGRIGWRFELRDGRARRVCRPASTGVAAGASNLNHIYRGTAEPPGAVGRAVECGVFGRWCGSSRGSRLECDIDERRSAAALGSARKLRRARDISHPQDDAGHECGEKVLAMGANDAPTNMTLLVTPKDGKDRERRWMRALYSAIATNTGLKG